MRVAALCGRYLTNSPIHPQIKRESTRTSTTQDQRISQNVASFTGHSLSVTVEIIGRAYLCELVIRARSISRNLALLSARLLGGRHTLIVFASRKLCR